MNNKMVHSFYLDIAFNRDDSPLDTGENPVKESPDEVKMENTRNNYTCSGGNFRRYLYVSI
jgi:hypothetical protein